MSAPDGPPHAGAIARLVSIVGHPALIVPAAGLARQFAHEGVRWPSTTASLLGAGVAAGCVMFYAVHKTRTGAWAHVDASRPEERRSHNAFASVVLGLSALASALADRHELAAVLAACCGVIAACALGARWLKFSQHVAFSALASMLVWPISPVAVVVGLLWTAAVAWSRLALRRHTAAEVVAGLMVGLLFGAALQAALAWQVS